MLKKVITLPLFIIFINNIVFSQYLEQRDIAIYKNNAERIFYILYEVGLKSEENVWIQYISVGRNTNNIFHLWRDFDENLSLSRFNEFINFRNIPDELELVFKDIGWEQNGHIKFWLIYYGLLVLQFEKYNDYLAENVFDENEEHLIRYYEDWQKAFSGLVSFIDVSDLEMIGSQFNVHLLSMEYYKYTISE